jgi:hypothetical protein
MVFLSFRVTRKVFVSPLSFSIRMAVTAYCSAR